MNVWLISILLGLVEGITEFIPVSSTGHLLIFEKWLHLEGTFFHTDFFNAVIQVGAVLAAVPLFRDRLQTLRQWREPGYRDYFLKLFVAFCLTAAGGLALKWGVRHFTGRKELLPESIYPVALALGIGGLLFIIVERWLSGRSLSNEVTWAMAIVIGCAQLLAVAFPGTSRSGATILLALLMGLGRGPAVEFSFLLGVPTLCAAGLLKAVEAIKEHEVILWGPLVVSTLVAAVASVLAVGWMIRYIRTHTFDGFGWYRLAVAAFLFAMLRTGHWNN